MQEATDIVASCFSYINATNKMKTERRPKSTFVRNNKAQMGTVMAILIGSITVLIGVIVFVQVFHALPEVGPTVENESWVFIDDAGNTSTWTKQLDHANVIEDTESVYSAATPGTLLVKDTDYNISYASGVLMNISAWANASSPFGVDYEYEEAGVVGVKTSVASIFYSAMGLVIIGFLVLAAVFILAVVGRLRGKGE